MIFLTITDGQFEIRIGNTSYRFTPDDEGKEDMTKFCQKHGIYGFTCSSSVDHPEDGGLDEGFDTTSFVDEVLGWVSVCASVPIEGLRNLLKNLEDDNTEPAIDTLRRWLSDIDNDDY